MKCIVIVLKRFRSEIQAVVLIREHETAADAFRRANEETFAKLAPSMPLLTLQAVMDEVDYVECPLWQ